MKEIKRSLDLKKSLATDHSAENKTTMRGFIPSHNPAPFPLPPLHASRELFDSKPRDYAQEAGDTSFVPNHECSMVFMTENEIRNMVEWKKFNGQLETQPDVLKQVQTLRATKICAHLEKLSTSLQQQLDRDDAVKNPGSCCGGANNSALKTKTKANTQSESQSTKDGKGESLSAQTTINGNESNVDENTNADENTTNNNGKNISTSESQINSNETLNKNNSKVKHKSSNSEIGTNNDSNIRITKNQQQQKIKLNKIKKTRKQFEQGEESAFNQSSSNNNTIVIDLDTKSLVHNSSNKIFGRYLLSSAEINQMKVEEANPKGLYDR